MSNKLKLAIIAAEVLAIGTLRLIYLIRRERDVIPRGAKVRHVKGRPVFGTPFAKHFSKASDRGPADVGQAAVGPKTIEVHGISIPVEDPDQE